MYSSTARTPYAPTGLDPASRRQSARSSQRYLVVIQAEKRGADRVKTRGTLLNVSTGGALVCAEDFIARQSPCTIEICGAEGRVIPNRTAGRVVGTALGPRGDFLLRIEFTEPLQTIKEPGKM